jgi:hypothetical protein
MTQLKTEDEDWADLWFNIHVIGLIYGARREEKQYVSTCDD